jgi:hypothetical protein
MTLDELIRDAAKRGELNSLSLVAVAGGFSASFTPASTYKVQFVNDPDPVIALTKVLKSVKLARPSNAPHFEPAQKPTGRPSMPISSGSDDLDFG